MKTPDSATNASELFLRMAVAVLCTISFSALAIGEIITSVHWVYLLAGIATAEFIFVFVYRAKAAKLSERPEIDCQDGMENIRQYMLQKKFFPITDSFVSPWFCGTKAEDIHYGDFADLIAYGFFYKTW
jgi:hypothetical protein